MKKLFTLVAAAFVALTMNATNLTVADAMTRGMALDSMATDTAVVTVEGYVINAGSYSMLYHNQTWFMADDSTASASDFEAYNCYAIQGADTLKVLNGDKVALTGKLKKYYNKSQAKFIIEIEKGDAAFIQMTDGDHSVVSTIEEATVAQALAIGTALADNASTEKQYKITGYVSAINVKSSDAWSDQYKNQSFWVADDPNSTASTNADGAFYVYRGKPETEAEIPVGTKVEFTCTIKKYVPSGGGDPVIENADQNIVIKILSAPEEETPDVKFEATDFAGLGKAATLEEPGGDVLLVKEGVTFHCDNAYGTDTYGVRCYKDGNLTISADTIIGKIAFELYGTYTGGLDPVVFVNDTIFEYTLPSQARMTTISIFFGEVEIPEVEVLSVAEALAIGALMDSTQVSDKLIIEGYVTQIDDNSFATQYKNMTFWIADEKGTAATNAEGALEIYRGKPDVELVVGDKVRVEGTIVNFKESVIETKSGAAVTKIAEEGIENIVLTEQAQKVMVDGVLYIVRDGKMFNVQGVQVR